MYLTMLKPWILPGLMKSSPQQAGSASALAKNHLNCLTFFQSVLNNRLDEAATRSNAPGIALTDTI